MRMRSFSPKGIEKYRPPEGGFEIFAMICDVHERVNREVETIPGPGDEFH